MPPTAPASSTASFARRPRSRYRSTQQARPGPASRASGDQSSRHTANRSRCSSVRSITRIRPPPSPAPRRPRHYSLSARRRQRPHRRGPVACRRHVPPHRAPVPGGLPRPPRLRHRGVRALLEAASAGTVPETFRLFVPGECSPSAPATPLTPATPPRWRRRGRRASPRSSASPEDGPRSSTSTPWPSPGPSPTPSRAAPSTPASRNWPPWWWRPWPRWGWMPGWARFRASTAPGSTASTPAAGAR